MGAPNQPQYPYGQQPHGQDPYGQQSGQNPYGQPPPGYQQQPPPVPVPAMNSVPQASTTGGRRPRPPVELIVSAVVWAGFGVFNIVMSIVYFVKRAGLTDSFLIGTGYTVAAFSLLGIGLVVLVLDVLVLRGLNAGRVALPMIGLLIILVTTNSDDPFLPEWLIAAVAVLLSVLLFLPRSNNYVAARAMYG